jgi:hypothetical protein
MNSIKIFALALILCGAAGFAYGKFSYTQETHEAKLGPFELSVKEKQTVSVPDWLAAALVGSGVLMLILDRRNA